MMYSTVVTLSTILVDRNPTIVIFFNIGIRTQVIFIAITVLFHILDCYCLWHWWQAFDNWDYAVNLIVVLKRDGTSGSVAIVNLPMSGSESPLAHSHVSSYHWLRFMNHDKVWNQINLRHGFPGQVPYLELVPDWFRFESATGQKKNKFLMAKMSLLINNDNKRSKVVQNYGVSSFQSYIDLKLSVLLEQVEIFSCDFYFEFQHFLKFRSAKLFSVSELIFRATLELMLTKLFTLSVSLSCSFSLFLTVG